MHKSLIALFLFTSAAAFANEAADAQANHAAFAGERTRAEVKAEVMHARSAGTLSTSDYTGNEQAGAAFTRSRAEVRAEAVQAARTRVIHEQI